MSADAPADADAVLRSIVSLWRAAEIKLGVARAHSVLGMATVARDGEHLVVVAMGSWAATKVERELGALLRDRRGWRRGVRAVSAEDFAALSARVQARLREAMADAEAGR